MQGTPSEKFKPVEMERRFQLTSETVIKKGDDRDKILDETENTLRWEAGRVGRHNVEGAELALRIEEAVL